MVPRVRKICCIGAGYVGGPTSAVIATQCPQLQVTVVDRDEKRIEQWNSWPLPIFEPSLDNLVKIARDGMDGRKPNLVFSSGVEAAILEAQLIFIAVNTPTKEGGNGGGSALNLAAVEGAARQIALLSTSDKIVVEKSTVPCGTANHLRRLFEEVANPGVHLEVVSNPEFLAEGTAIHNLLEPDRVLIGSSGTERGLTAADALRTVYSEWVPSERIVDVDVATSELAKLAANCMLAQRVSTINSLSALCEAEGANINELSQAVGLDTRIGSQFLKASVGFGGSCFRKDLLSLIYMAESRHLGEVASYWKGVLDINEYQGARFMKRILSALNNTLTNKRIAVLGYAYKKNTSDSRESPAIDIVDQLVNEGAFVQIFDPKVGKQQIYQDAVRNFGPEFNRGWIAVCNDPYEACRNAAAVIILTDWDMFRGHDTASSPTAVGVTPIAKEDPDTRKLETPNGAAVKHPRQATSMNGHRQNNSEANGVCSTSSTIPESMSDTGAASGAYGEQLDWARIGRIVSRPRMIFDGRNIVDSRQLRELGFRVYGIGIPNK